MYWHQWVSSPASVWNANDSDVGLTAPASVVAGGLGDEDDEHAANANVTSEAARTASTTFLELFFCMVSCTPPSGRRGTPRCTGYRCTPSTRHRTWRTRPRSSSAS